MNAAPAPRNEPNPQDAVWIDDLRLEVSERGQELSARVDGERVWFRFSDNAPVELTAEPFLAIALQEAMVRGVPLRLCDSVTVPERLLTGLSALQDLFLCWNNEDFRRVPIEAQVGEEPARSGITLSSFSGGIDSSFTYVTECQRITHLLLVQGFDGNFGDEVWQRNVAARAAFARAEGKSLITVETNARPFMEGRRLSWSMLHGSLLAALGVAMRADRMFVPSSFTLNDLFPWGSHPLLEPLWSTGVTQVLHHGAQVHRSAKTAVIAQHPGALDQLQVCWRGVDSNCGACPKCLRTSLALHLLGRSSSKLPPYTQVGQLRWLKPSNPQSLAFTEDLIQFAFQHGRPDIARRLKSYRRHYLVRFHAAELVKVYGARWARKLARRWARKDWHGDRAKLQSARRWLE